MLTDSDDTEMIDRDEEDKDLESQVSRGQSDDLRNHIDTPDAQSAESRETSHTPAAVEGEDPFDGPSSPSTSGPLAAHEAPKPKLKAAADSDIPTKLVNPPTHNS